MVVLPKAKSMLETRLRAIHWTDRVTGKVDRLSDRQVMALEELAKTWRTALQSSASKPTPVTPIREHLGKFRRQVAAAEIQLRKMQDGAQRVTPLRDAHNQLLAASLEMDCFEEMQNALAKLSQIVVIAERALATLPRQTRHRTASPLIVARIWSALLNNHAQMNPDTGRYTVRPMSLRVSSAANSAFREICAVMYEEITGKRDADPERAIRAFIRLHKKKRGTRAAEKS